MLVRLRKLYKVNMAKILVLQGIPGAGKSFWAKEFLKNNKNWIRVNRDDIRRMFGEYWVPKREHLVEATEYAIADEAILNGWNVIVDDTNLNPNYIEGWKECAQMNLCDIEFKKFNISLEEAIRRDSLRENPVGEDVIRKFYNKYYADF